MAHQGHLICRGNGYDNPNPVQGGKHQPPKGLPFHPHQGRYTAKDDLQPRLHVSAPVTGAPRYDPANTLGIGRDDLEDL